MKLALTLVLTFGLLYYPYAQNSVFVVEVGAFAEPVSINYFSKLDNVYEAVGVNQIYRYRINATTQEEANTIKENAVGKGFVNARIIDINAIKEQCDIECGYTPPKPTGNGTIGLERANIYELNKKNPPPNSRGNIDVENANMYELESNRGEIDIVDVSKFEFKKGDKIECLFFDYDSYLLRDKSKTELNKLAWFLSQNRSYSINIKSYTDSKGSDLYNTRLAKNRANSTKKYLMRLGVHSSQISTEIHGEKDPIAINETLDGKDSGEGRQYNRRIELKVYDVNKQPIDIIKTIFVPKPLRSKNSE